MRSVVTTWLLLIACLLNQVYQAVPLHGDSPGARVAAAQPPATDLLLRSSDVSRLPRIAEALLIVYVVPQVGTIALGRAADDSVGRGGELRPTLQTLDVRRQV